VPKSPIILASIFAALLAVVAFAPLPGTGREADASPVVVLPLSPSEIAGVSVTTSAGVSQQLRYDRDFAGWVVSLDDGIVWLASDNIVRGGLRQLGRLSGTPVERDDAEGDSGPEITVTNREGSAWTVRFDQAPLGGRAVATIESPEGSTRAVWLDASVYEIFSGGLSGWLDRSASPGPEIRSGTLALRNNSGAVAFQRARRRWAIVAPVVERADDAAVSRLLGSIRSIELDAISAATEPAPESTVASIELISQMGTTGGTRTRLDILGVSTLRPNAVRVRTMVERIGADGAVESTLGPVVGAAAAETLGALRLDPVEYLPRRAIQTEGAPIATVELRTAPAFDPQGPQLTADVLEPVFVKVAGAWSAEQGSAEAAAPLVGLLTAQDAARMALEAPEGFSGSLLVRVGDDAGRPIGIAVLGTATIDGAETLVVQTGSVFRGYDGPAAQAVLALMTQTQPG